MSVRVQRRPGGFSGRRLIAAPDSEAKMLRSENRDEIGAGDGGCDRTAEGRPEYRYDEDEHGVR